MKQLFALLLLVGAAISQAQEHVHAAAALVAPAVQEHLDEPAPAAAAEAHVHDATAEVATPALLQQMAADELGPAMQQAVHMNRMMHGETLNWLLMADRLEATEQDSADALQWELQGWLGYDAHKLWFKSEGNHDRSTNDTEDAELQLLYSMAIAPYWDVQAGLRHDDGAAGTRSYAAFGVLGLAPYWFETDAALFLSEAGKWSARLEVEYELRFTQRLILQPRLELNYALSDDAAAGVLQGFNDTSLGLRLRYEVLREVAPYIGVEWWQASGATATALRRAGDDASEARVVAGFRLWY